MNKQIYLGGTPLIDLTGYATENYVDTQIANVDVTDQLTNYVQKTALDASYGALDASIKSTDASIAGLKSVVAQITGEGAEVTAAIDTFNELKQFVADYTNSNDLSTLISTVKTQAVNDASADAASKYQPKGNYITEADLSGYVDADDVASAINSSIAALDLANTYQPKGNYLTAADLPTNHVAGSGVTNIVTISAADYAALATKSATTLYIVSD